MSKQQGYSPFVVGIILRISPLPSLVMRPLVGAIVNKYKCPKLALMITVVIGFMTVCALMLMPGPVVYGEIDDDVLFRTPLF
ncbi:Major facilitator superfamily domain [Cinara cedri]|uniref:Major facilitator superfamily domain n=1 Tax=Cinara cedri TaxID=506608 RepID=A0A5E4MPA7_9HEMI|nr:Major facilitator superfamily domain [Cinara cedri]